MTQKELVNSLDGPPGRVTKFFVGEIEEAACICSCPRSFGGNIIKAFLKTLIKVSKEIDPEYGLLKRPEKENAGELLFVRRLGIFLYSYYGSFLYEVVANTASAILDNPDIDKDTVRFALKGIDMDVVNKYEQMF